MAYAATLVQACRSKGLRSIAITDHHDLSFVPFIRKAAEEETDEGGKPLPKNQRLIVYPGVELTLGVPCQALLILDADFPEDRFDNVLTALTLQPSPASDAKTAPVAQIANVSTFRQLKEQLDAHKWLQNRYIVLPNVTGEGKHSLLRSGQAAKYADMPCVGGYVDGDIEGLKEGPRNILAGKDKAWGNKRIACVQTSDARREDHSTLGVHTTWIKWAVPTAEALRQACLAQESRISHTEPKLPAVVISGISVSNSQFLGPVELDFNPQYNALIGGRGTGKSTILEYLRWALCDQPPALDSEDAPNYQNRRSRLIENTLKPHGATVDITFAVNGVPHVVRRSSRDGALLIKIADAEFRPCTEGDVRDLLPVQAYSQKQLSDVSVRVDELTRFIEAPIRTELAAVARQIEEKAERIRQTYATRRRQQSLTAEIAKRALEAKSLDEQAASIRKSLTGLTDADRALLDQGRHYDAAGQVVELWRSDINSVVQGAEELARRVTLNIDQAPPAPSSPDAELLERIRSDYLAFQAHARNVLAELAEKGTALLASAEIETDTGPWRAWTAKLSEFQEAYSAAVQRSSAHRERMEQLKAIEARLAIHNRETARLGEELKGLQAAADTYAAERKAWLELLEQRDQLLDKQCRVLTETSAGAIRAQVLRHHDTSPFMRKLQEVLSGSSIRANRFEAMAGALAEATGRQDHWLKLLEDLEALAGFKPEQDSTESCKRRSNNPSVKQPSWSVAPE